MRALLDKKRKIQPVEVNGSTYYVRSMSLADRLKLSQLMNGDKSQLHLSACMVRLCACNEDGSECFTDDDIPAIKAAEDATELQKVMSVTFELNGYAKGAVDEAKKD